MDDFIRLDRRLLSVEDGHTGHAEHTLRIVLSTFHPMPDQLFPHILVVGPVSDKLVAGEDFVIAGRAAPKLLIPFGRDV